MRDVVKQGALLYVRYFLR